MALISYAIFFYSKTTPFPGLHALAPTLGTALIIVYGTHSTVVGKLLGCRLLVGIGLISYSAYLWHQPIFAFTRQISPLPPSSLIMSGLTLAALAAAYCSWKYVETPFRNKTAFSRHQIFTYSAIGSFILIGIGIAGHATDGFKQRLTDAQRTLVAFEKYDYEAIYRAGNCFVDSRKTNESFADNCHSGNLSGDILLWGDSHAAALSFGLRQMGSISQFTSSGCVPIPSRTGDQSDKCRQLNSLIQNTIRQKRPAAVILHANWSRYSQYTLQSELRETIQFIRSAAPGASITIIGSVPQWSPSLPALLAQKYGHIEKAGMAYNAKISELNELDQQLKQLSTEDGVTFLSALDALCLGNECQATVRTETNLTLTAWDYGHLTGEGSVLLASRLFPHGLGHLSKNAGL